MPASMTRRQLIQGLAVMAPAAAVVTTKPARRALMAAGIGASVTAQTAIGPLSADLLPEGVRSRFVDDINGLRVHVLEAGFEGRR